MKKHFLLLLMAFMSLAGWAQTDVIITVKNLSAQYGTLDVNECPPLQASDIVVTSGAVDKSLILPCLRVTRVQSGRTAGTYDVLVEQINSTETYNIVVSNTPKLIIAKKVIDFTATYTKIYDGQPMSAVTINDANAATLVPGFGKAEWDSWADLNLTLSPVGDQAEKINANTYAANVDATISDAVKDNYAFTATKGALTISKRNISVPENGVTVTLSQESAEYVAAGQTPPTITVSYGTATLVEGDTKDYTYAWDPAPVSGKFTASQTYTATVTGQGNFSGTQTAQFKINGTSLAGAVVNLTIPAGGYIYSGAAKEPAVASVVVGENTYTSETATKISDLFTIAYSNNTNAGEATVTLTGKDNTTYFNQTATATFNIAQLDLSLAASNVTIDDITAVTYNTKEQKPVPVVKVDNVALAATVGEDDAMVTNWTATYANNTNATATSLATVTVTGAGNYKGSKTTTFVISPKSIATLDASDFAAYDDETYTGAQITPATTGKVKFTHTPAAGDTPAQSVTLVQGTDYTVTYGDNINYVATNAGSVTYTGTGNYTGTKTVNFNILKKALVITAKSYTIDYGTARPTYEVEYDGLVASDLENGAPKAGVFSTPVTVTQCTYNTTTANDNTNAGTYSLVPAGAVAPNYSIDATTGYVPGKLIINANLVTLKVVNKKVPFGTAEPAYTNGAVEYNGTNNATNFYQLEIVGDASATLASLINSQVFTFTRSEAANKTVGTYTISVTGPEALAGGYQATYQDGTLEIEKLKLVAVAQDKAISWHGGEPAMAEGYDALTNAANIGFKTYVDNDATKALTGVTLPAADYAGVSNPTAIANVVSKIEWVNEAGEAYTSGWEKGHPGTIHVTLLTDLSAYTANYDITTKDGAVTFNDIDVAAFALDGSAAGQFAAIQEADNLTYTTVTVKPAKRNGTVALQAEKWNVYVLPFATSVRELSTLPGVDYAVVNIINEESTNGIQFKLHMGAIPANTPFAMKTLTALDGATLTFANKKIVNGADADGYVVCPVGQTGVKFVGCYAEKELTTADGDSKRFLVNDGWHYCSSNPYTVKPFEAYMDYTESTLAPGMGFITFEEMDGSTTAISPVTFTGKSAKLAAEGWYTVGGMKMQGAPTQKGVYIKDGKKVVIK